MYKHFLSALWVVLLIGAPFVAWAQTTFDPSSPAEPNAYFRLTTTVSPAGAGYTSGSGLYMEGSSASVYTSAYSGYTFSHWELRATGATLSTSTSFSYTVRDRKDTLVAVYQFTPPSPSEPDYSNAFRLYLTTNMEGYCSFSRTSGTKVEEGAYVSITAYPSTGYLFDGWYSKGTKVSSAASFTYLMGAEHTTLQAVLTFNPSNPDEPGYTEYVATGDINGDGSTDASDVVMLVQSYAQGTTSSLQKSVADINHDGLIDASDIVALVNRYINSH